MEITIRKCNDQDLDQLRALAVETFKNNYQHKNKPDNFKSYLEKAFNKARLLEELKDPQSDYFFVIHQDELIGYLKLNIDEAQTESKGPNALEIERIYILKTYQGKGLGRKLLNFTIEQCRDKNKQFIWLGVWENNPDAIQFYERCGMKKFGEHVFQLGDEAQTDYLMRLDLD